MTETQRDPAIDRAMQLQAAGHFPQAEVVLLQLLARRPRDVEAMHLLASQVGQQGRMDRAIQLLKQAVAIEPTDPKIFYHLGIALGNKNRQREAADVYRRAIELQPDFAEAHTNLGMTLLIQGDFENGLAEYEWRWGSQFMEKSRPLWQPRWEGERLAGRILLLRAEQGFGDTIQYIRFAGHPALAGGEVILQCQPALGRLLSACAGLSRIIPEGAEVPSVDFHLPLLSLPRVLGTRLESIPTPVPYVRVPKLMVDAWAQRIARLPRSQPNPLRVGLVWAGSTANINDPNRSIQAAMFRGLQVVPGVEFFSLQKGEPAKQADAGLPSLIDFTAELHDFADTAALISNLDLVITVDTSVAHLAGAMNKPVWILLPFFPDWRWLLDRADSPWYPSVRLFRQPSAGDWSSAIVALTARLRQMVVDSSIPIC